MKLEKKTHTGPECNLWVYISDDSLGVRGQRGAFYTLNVFNGSLVTPVRAHTHTHWWLIFGHVCMVDWTFLLNGCWRNSTLKWQINKTSIKVNSKLLHVLCVHFVFIVVFNDLLFEEDPECSFSDYLYFWSSAFPLQIPLLDSNR